MSTIKQSVFLVVASLASTLVLGQAGVGHSTRATAGKGVNVHASSHAAAKASTKSAAAATKATAAASKTKPASVKTTTAATTTTSTRENKGRTVREESRVNGRTTANASANEKGKTSANENSVFGTPGSVEAESETPVTLRKDKKAPKEKAAPKKVATEKKAKSRTKEDGNEIAETTETATTETTTTATTEAAPAEKTDDQHAKSRAPERASATAKEHANENSAIFGKQPEVLGTDGSEPSQPGTLTEEAKVKTKVKAEKKTKKTK